MPSAEHSYLKRDLIEVEAVAHVVVCADSLWVIVHHDGFIAHLKKNHQNMTISAFVQHSSNK